MPDGDPWQEKMVRLGGDLLLLVIRSKRDSGEWWIEAWLLAPRGEGMFRNRDGRWYIRPLERTAKRAIVTAFPGIRGEWKGTHLVQATSDP